MPGPMSAPNGDSTLVLGGADVCVKCAKCFNCAAQGNCDTHEPCEDGCEKRDMITLREWLHRRNRLRTGKTLRRK